jgi:curli biogenesis system outer membrane secretion channel CsgG
VTRFDQEVAHILNGCTRWHYSFQDQLQTELERELSLRGLKVLERRQIRKILSDEHELPNFDTGSAPKSGKFLAAQFTITGAITEQGVCEDSAATSVQLGGIVSLLGGPSADVDVGVHHAVSKVKLVAQVLSVETGEILKSFEARAEIKDHGYGVEGQTLGIGAGHRQRKSPPMEKASNQAIQSLATQIASYVTQAK